jgi:hypothetical protein
VVAVRVDLAGTTTVAAVAVAVLGRAVVVAVDRVAETSSFRISGM